MIKEGQKIKICVVRNNIKNYYEEKGYQIKKLGEYIEVKAEDVSSGSHQKITYICDYCGEEFTRSIYSNERSKKGSNKKDACQKCSRTKRNKETNLIKYGVDNPMKVKEFQLECQNSKEDNFKNNGYSSKFFEKGIPVSEGQMNIYKLLDNFEINYHYLTYYIDLVKDYVAIEYDGRGHDLGLRMGKISKNDFMKKEQEKQKEILKVFRLLRIIDKKDKLKKKENIDFYKIKEQIDIFIKSDDLYKEIIID